MRDATPFLSVVRAIGLAHRSALSPLRGKAKVRKGSTAAVLEKSSERRVLAPQRKSRPLISTFPYSLNCRRRSFRSAMRSNRLRWRPSPFDGLWKALRLRPWWV
jgi:hypothetical protein